MSCFMSRPTIDLSLIHILSEQLTDWAMKFLPVLDAEQMIRANGEDAARN